MRKLLSMSVERLGWRCMLGLDGTSKTTENLIRTGECVLNLPSVNGVGAVNRLARLTGSDPVPEGKLGRGYRHEAKKFEIAGLTKAPSEAVSPLRVIECPIPSPIPPTSGSAGNRDRTGLCGGTLGGLDA